MKLGDVARGLVPKANNVGSSRPVMGEEARKETTESAKEVIQRVDTEGIVEVTDAIEKLNGLIYCFTNMTQRLEVEKREIYQIAKEAQKQKIETDKLLFDLNQATKVFPKIAGESIHAAVGATAHSLDESIDGLVAEVRHGISQIFRKEVETLKQASIKAAKSADDLVDAKKFIGWQFIGISLLVVIIATFLSVKYVTPQIQPYEPTAEEQKYIKYGRFLQNVWPKLSAKAQQELKAAAKSGN
ncbi:hypothetical protein [Geotalea toluenoxydans]|uniref:hypothetical protein n=1 Tax=Geotalea toluenoxydans TaxID=421624 RepID=UPI0006D2954A|nr:hypothetical protein [Geotalea toluenoxydans]